jgi:hypothetical protein
LRIQETWGLILWLGRETGHNHAQAESLCYETSTLTTTFLHATGSATAIPG